MSNTINFEVIDIDNDYGYACLETEQGLAIEMRLEDLPSNLKEGRFLKFVISHTDYDPNKEERDTSIKPLVKPNFSPTKNQLSF